MDAQSGSATVPVVKEVTLRLARPEERQRWESLMDRHHPLGFKPMRTAACLAKT
ncbi:MAG: hypothetical protein OXC19_14785 [Bryobacterales bacterium]|nr:hypothetical protein [Bryobacterales bacterium]